MIMLLSLVCCLLSQLAEGHPAPQMVTVHSRSNSGYPETTEQNHIGCYALNRPAFLPNIPVCEGDERVFAIQTRGCNNPFNGYFVGLSYRRALGPEHHLVLDPLQQYESSPSLFYLDKDAHMFVVPETSFNATNVTNSPIILNYDDQEHGDYAGDLLFNTTEWYKFNSDSQSHHFVPDPVTWRIGTNGRLRAHGEFSKYRHLYGGTRRMVDGPMGIWNGVGPSDGPPQFSIRSSKFYALPACRTASYIAADSKDENFFLDVQHKINSVKKDTNSSA